MLEPKLEIQVIWKDEYMIELGITACNGFYRGSTKVYANGDDLVDFGNSLIDFPKTREQVLVFEAGKQDGYAYFSMRLYRIDALGHTAMQIKLDDETTGERPEARDKVQLELMFEPAALDVFREQLVQVGRTRAGKAVLLGYVARNRRDSSSR